MEQHTEDTGAPWPGRINFGKIGRKRARKSDKAREDRQHEDRPEGLLPYTSSDEWDDDDVPVREWYLEGLFPASQVSILTAEGGTGKSLIGIQAGVASVLRKDFLGLKIKPGIVLYFGAEDSEDEFKRRLNDVARSHGVSRSKLKEFKLIPMAGEDALLCEARGKDGIKATPLWDRLVATIGYLKPVALFLDTAADIYGGDELKRSQVRAFISQLRSLAIEKEVAIVLLYHPSRSGIESGKGESGSTAWFNSVRASVFMTDEKDESGDLRRIRNTKSNYGKKGNGFVVKYSRGVFVLHDENAPPTTEELKRRDNSDVEFMSRFMEYRSKASNKPLSNGKTSPYYAPKKLLEMGPCIFTDKDFEGSMRRLIGDKLDISEIRENGRSRAILSLNTRIEEGARRYGDDD